MEKQEERVDVAGVKQIKTNVGHSEAASGLTSIMKVVMAFEQGQIPPTRGVKKLNPKCELFFPFYDPTLKLSTPYYYDHPYYHCDH